MKTSLIRYAGIGLLALGLAAGPAAAQESDFDTWDANADAGLDMEEFGTGFGEAGTYGTWDTDSDECITSAEFNAGIGENTEAFEEQFGADTYGEWDANADDCLDENEFTEGVYSSYDVDDDKILTPDEFGARPGDLGEEGWFDF